MAKLVAPSAPRIEHRTDAGTILGLGVTRPRLSWRIDAADEDYRQSSYQLEITRGATHVWTVESAEQVLVPWPDSDLRSRERVTVRVRVRGGDEWSPWSETTTAEAGLFSPADWAGSFISPEGIGGLGQPAPELRGVLDLPGDIISARLFATAHGVYSARVNGRPVYDSVLAPGWTAYQHRLRYAAFDVTELVTGGANTLDITLGNGWWRGRFGFLGERAIYGDRLALLAQLEVTTSAGTVHVLSTDDRWRARSTGILADDIYDGSTIDLGHPADAPFDAGVETSPSDLSVLVAADGPPLRVTETIPATSVTVSPSGKTLVDFGQNAVGWVRVRAPRGSTEVVVRHAEVLEAGELGTGPLRSARATDTYFLSGEHAEVLEPVFTFHGFRYAEISGIDDLRAEDVEALVVGSDMERAGWFSSSHDLLNRFHENVVWGMRGNFLDVPMDCPQRDERLGWTGDIQVFAPTATFLFDSAGFLTSWLADLAAEQHNDGSVPHVVPDILRTALTSSPAAAWGDAATVVPWVLWERTGDSGILRRQYPSMKAWVERVLEFTDADNIWRGGFQYGDWLDPTAPHDDAAQAKADPDVVATAHLARSAQIVADTAHVLGLHGDAVRFAQVAEDVRNAFQHAFVTPAGRILSDAQTVYAIALQWDLLTDQDQRARAAERLADLVRTSAFRISTGFIGTPVICDALTESGYPDIAFRLLFQTKAPSWLYPVTMGATTVWERWDSLLPDGTINPSGMTSFNHYALGSVVDWVHRRIAGLAPTSPGYRTIAVRPHPPSQLQYATARHITPYGEASVAWTRSQGRFVLDVAVPVGVRADIELPWGAGRSQVGHGVHHFEIDDHTPPAAPSATVRDILDDDATLAELVEIIGSAVLAADEQRVAQLLAPYLDHPAADLVDGIWTKGWPSESTKERLQAFVRRHTARDPQDQDAHV